MLLSRSGPGGGQLCFQGVPEVLSLRYLDVEFVLSLVSLAPKAPKLEKMGEEPLHESLADETAFPEELEY